MTDSYKSIHTMIKRVDDNIKDTYSKLAEKGATVPAVANQNSEGLSSAVETVKSSTASLCPIEPCGLSFWIDGDANVRQYTASNENPYTVNRSNGFMENLMYDRLVKENTSNSNAFTIKYPESTSIKATGTWKNNTIIVNAVTWYPYFSCDSFSVEVVAGKAVANPTDDRLLISHYWFEGWLLELLKNNSVRAGILASNGSLDQSAKYITCNFASKATLTDSNLLYYVLTYNAKTAKGKLYIYGNNALLMSGSVDCPYYVSNNVFPLSIGGKTHVLNGSGYSNYISYKGYRLGMVRGWNRVLTQAEMLAAYKNVKERFNNVI